MTFVIFFHTGRVPYFSVQTKRGSHPEVFLEKGVLKINDKFTREHPWRSVISIKQRY